MSYLWLLDNGHGSDTAGKRSPVWPDGRQLREYEFNRDIVYRMMLLLDPLGVDYEIISPELYDIGLSARTRRANAFHNEYNCIYVSVHANAGGGTGWSVFTSKGETRSDTIATVFWNTAQAHFPWARMREDFYSDGDADKEANFKVLKYTKMPAILTENFFMDTLEPDCEYLMSEVGRAAIAAMHVDAIVQVENNSAP
jgi:N-acetylmuramoyl-L-alanine amidase